jgi:8-oxo-dGTP diphosphatase
MEEMIAPYSVPRVGLGVLVLRDGKCLLAKRWEKDGSFVWCMPGGHLELGESFEECAHRETLEEAGVEIENVRCVAISNWPNYLSKHFIRFGMAADYKSGELRDEEGKMTDWEWFPLTELPEPIFLPSKTLVQEFLEGKSTYIDTSHV